MVWSSCQATPVTPPAWAFCEDAQLSVFVNVGDDGTYLDWNLLERLFDVVDVNAFV
jgi:hypothetical protein